MKSFKRMLIIVPALIVTYFVFGLYLDSVFIRPAKADLTNYFQPGDRLVSRFEGFEQTVLSARDGYIHTRLVVRPHAAGPPEHFHENFSETFTVKSGTLSVLIDGEKRTLRAGETLTIPPMTRHKPFNESDETVIVEGEDPKTVPVEFGFVLTQLYGFMDEFENGPSVPQMLMQLSVYGSDADSYLADGPPIAVQKAMRSAMAPTARLLGYKTHYEQYRPQRPDMAAR